MLHYLEAGMMENISKKEVAGDIVEVLAITITLEAEKDEDGHLTSLNIISDLMGKSKPDSKWLDYFAKLGVVRQPGHGRDGDRDRYCGR